MKMAPERCPREDLPEGPPGDFPETFQKPPRDIAEISWKAFSIDYKTKWFPRDILEKIRDTSQRFPGDHLILISRQIGSPETSRRRFSGETSQILPKCLPETSRKAFAIDFNTNCVPRDVPEKTSWRDCLGTSQRLSGHFPDIARTAFNINFSADWLPSAN